MGLVVTKLVFGVSDKVRFKQVCSATETSWKIEILLVASLDMILSNKRITKALIRLGGCTGWSADAQAGLHLCSQIYEDMFCRVEVHIYCIHKLKICFQSEIHKNRAKTNHSSCFFFVVSPVKLLKCIF